MTTTLAHSLRSLACAALVAGLTAACSTEASIAPVNEGTHTSAIDGASLAVAAQADTNMVMATIRQATARYARLDVALADGFVLLHGCESRPGEGPVGTVYVHIGRLLDGRIDPASPDALIYEPSKNGNLSLVGAEFATPYAMWPGSTPPQFMGATFQPEDEFGVWALHAWVWRPNPEGMFAQTNSRVSCGDA